MRIRLKNNYKLFDTVLTYKNVENIYLKNKFED